MKKFERKSDLNKFKQILRKRINEAEIEDEESPEYQMPAEYAYRQEKYPNNIHGIMGDETIDDGFEDGEIDIYSNNDLAFDGDVFMELEDLLAADGHDANAIANIMKYHASTIAELVDEGKSAEEIKEVIDRMEEHDLDTELEEAKRIIIRNGLKFVKESKRYSSKHPVFSGKEFQEYLLKECGVNCCTGDDCDDCEDYDDYEYVCCICGEGADTDRHGYYDKHGDWYCSWKCYQHYIDRLEPDGDARYDAMRDDYYSNR